MEKTGGSRKSPKHYHISCVLILKAEALLLPEENRVSGGALELGVVAVGEA